MDIDQDSKTMGMKRKRRPTAIAKVAGEGGWYDDALASANASPMRSSGSILSCRVLIGGVQCKDEKSTTLGA